MEIVNTAASLERKAERLREILASHAGLIVAYWVAWIPLFLPGWRTKYSAARCAL